MGDLAKLGTNDNPLVTASKINFHSQSDGVILENQETSSVFISVDENNTINFRTFKEEPSQSIFHS